MAHMKRVQDTALEVMTIIPVLAHITLELVPARMVLAAELQTVQSSTIPQTVVWRRVVLGRLQLQ